MAADFLKYLFGALAGGAESAFGEYRRREDLKREEADKAEARAFRNKQFDFQQKQFDTGARGHRIDRAMSLDPGTELTESLTRDFTDEGLPIRKEAVVTEDSSVTPLLHSLKTPRQNVVKSNPFISDDVKTSVSFGGQAPVKEPSTVIPFEGTGMRGEMKGFRPLTLEEASRKAFTDAVNADTGMDSGMRTTLLGRVAGINTPTPAARTQPDPRQQAALQLITGNPDATVESLSPEQALKFFQMTGTDKSDPLNEWTMISGALGFGANPTQWTPEQRKAIIAERERLQQSGQGSGSGGLRDAQRLNLENRYASNLDRLTQDSRTAVQQSQVAEAGYNTWLQAKKNGQPLGPASQAMIMSFGKVLDPGSVVRESEYNRSAEMQSMFNRFDALKTRVLQGGIIADSEVEELMRTLKAVKSSYRNNQIDYLRRAKSQTGSIGGNFTSVATPDQIELLNQADAEQKLASAQPGSTLAIDGVTYVKLSNGSVVKK